jgi:hypothetical protein
VSRMVQSCNEVTASIHIHVQVMIWIESVAKPRLAYLGGKMYAFVANREGRALVGGSWPSIHLFQS